MPSLLLNLFPVIEKIISKYITNKEDVEKIKQDIVTELVINKSNIIQTEAQSDSWITRSWRPIVMLTFTGLIVMDWLGYSAVNIDTKLKMELYEIVKLGLGGYIGARTIEKVAKILNKNKI